MNKIIELYEYRQMLKSLTQSDLRTRYKGSVLGFFWTFLNPLLMLLIYTVVFSTVMRIDIPNYTMFLFTGLLPWTYFQTSVLNSSGSILRNANLIKKIYFPREVLPLSVVLGGLFNYLFGLCIMLPALLITKVYLSPTVLYFPIVLLLQTILIIGISFLVSSLTVYLRDLEHMLGILLMAWFYITPVIFPSSYIPEKFKIYFDINPMKPIIEAYQSIFFYKQAPDLHRLLWMFMISLLILVIGSYVFHKLNKRFAEEV